MPPATVPVGTSGHSPPFSTAGGTGENIDRWGSKGLAMFPSPSHGEVVVEIEHPGFGKRRMDIIDMQGEFVRTIEFGVMEEEERWRMIWDGRTDEGDLYPGGHYIVRVHTGQEEREVLLSR